jgi:hypothetical protein
MTNGRLIVAAVLAIALFVAVGVALTYRATEYEPSAEANLHHAAAAGLPPRGERGVAGTSGAGTSAAATAASSSVPGDTGKAGVPSGAMRMMPRAVARRDALRSARRELIAGFSDLRRPVESCGAQGASFVLGLVADAGAVRVESARVEGRGPASDSALACAQSALSGQVIPSAHVFPGRRWEIPFSVAAPTATP